MFSFGLPCEVVVMVWQRQLEEGAAMELALVEVVALAFEVMVCSSLKRELVGCGS